MARYEVKGNLSWARFEGIWGSSGIAPLNLKLGTDVVSGQLHVSVALRSERTLGVHWAVAGWNSATWLQTLFRRGTGSLIIDVQIGRCGPGSVVGIATGYGLDGPGIESRWGARFSAPVQTGPGAHLASCTMGTGSFPGVKSGRGVTLTPQPLLVPWSRKGRDIPLLPLWVVRPLQSLSACTRVHFILNRKGSFIV